MTSRPFDVELSLRQHGASLRQLAAELLRDPDAADDAVQEVWAAALQRPPRHAGSPGGWLATALRNVARKLRRGERRRARREAVVARGGEVEDHAVVAAREELLHRLVAEVSALEAPFREAIWRRFFEGLAPREIAASSGVPVATVKSRLQRGLQQLREKLGEDGESGWRSALAVAFGMKDGAVPAGAAGTTATAWSGVLLMTAWTKTLAAVAVVAIVGVLLWSLDEPNVAPPNGGGAKPESSVAAAASGAQDRTQSGVGREPAVVELASPTPATPKPAHVRGRIVAAETREPLAGIEVTLPFGISVQGDPRDVRIVTVDDGRFEFEIAAGRASRVSARSFDRCEVTSSGTNLAAGQFEDLGDVPLRLGGVLRGRVVDEAGVALPAGIMLSFEFPASWSSAWREQGITVAHTDAQGCFALSTAVPLGSVKLSIPRSAFELVSPKEVVVRERETLDLTIVARARPQIRGIVTDENGQPLAGIGLGTTAGMSSEVATDANGSFALTRRVPAASTVVLVTEAGPCDPHPPIPDVAWGTDGLRIVLHRSVPFAIEVVGPDGAPIEQFGVALDRPGVEASERGKVAHRGHHAGGRLAVERVARGQTSLRILPTAIEWTPNEPIAAGDTEPLRIVLQRRLSCVVQVVAADRPVQGALVELVHERGTLTANSNLRLHDPRADNDRAWLPGLWSELLSSARTDAEGKASLWRDRELAERLLRVQVEGRATLLVRSLEFPADGQPLRVELPAVGTIAGRVELRDRNRLDVRVKITSAHRTEYLTPEPDGSFASPPLGVGRYTVALWLSLHRRLGVVVGSECEVLVEDGQTANVVFDLANVATSRVRGSVAADGPLPAGLEIDFVRQDAGESPGLLGSAVVAADGSFAITDLLPGSYRLALRTAPLDRVFVPALLAEPLVLVGGEEAQRRVTFTRRRLVVKLVRPDGTSAKGERVRARCAGAVWPATLFPPAVDETVVIDPAPTLPIEFALTNAPWSAPVQMPQDLTSTEVTVVLPIAPR